MSPNAVGVEVRRARERRAARTGAEEAAAGVGGRHRCDDEHGGVHRRNGGQATSAGDRNAHERQLRPDAAGELVRRRDWQRVCR